MFWGIKQKVKIKEILTQTRERLDNIRQRHLAVIRAFEEQKNQREHKSIWKKILQL